MSADFFTTLDPGDRIVVRYRLDSSASGAGHEASGAASEGPRLSDAIGHFLALEDGVLTVETRSGMVAIQRADVTHAKRVPPAPQRRRSRHG
ncbi:hypothetical protein [Arthrobacter sp. JSM 101049]|uniref:putative acetyltransferase n=1 Tax=Arthrobacter sp. JSM 101049 TaxID=929097 RepID=UPI00356164E5